MAEQDTARTIIFDLVQLEKLGAELERRYRINPTTRVMDVLTHIDPEDHALYVPQLSRLLEDLVLRCEAGTMIAMVAMDAKPEPTGEIGDSIRRSLLATAIVEDSNTDGSKPPSGKGSSGGNKRDRPGESGAPERIDQFRILRELGAGAFGVVYLAEDELLQRKVAIKVPKVSDPTRSASYINEARKAAAIDCKGIVPIYHVGMKENGIPFVVQKLIDGPSLRFLLSRYGSLPPAHAVTLMRDIAIALGSAHRLGIYHRDLKPDNVLIDGSGVPWIADFGLAISESEQAQRKGEVAGSLMYMSPEQIQGRADWLDGRSDIWALGIMLHELLLGKPPFSGKNQQSLMEQICHREPRPLQQSSTDLTALNHVFTKCCAKSPGDRYGSVEELAQDLDTLILEGLSTLPLDGSELRFEQPISQYASNDSSGSRSRSGLSGAGTQLSGRGSTLVIGGGSTSQSSGGQGTARSHVSADGSSIRTAGLGDFGDLPQPSVASRAEQWTRMVMIGVGLTSITAIGAQQWYSRMPNLSNASVADASKAELVEPLENNPILPPPETKVIEPAPVPANALTLSEADGSEKLPWIVAGDGSGSHQTIGDAIASSRPGAFVKIKPGNYSESLKLTQPLNLVGLGDPGTCVISNANAPPIEIASSQGTIYLSNLSIRGDAVQSGREFNGIELTSGKLKLEQCYIRSSTWNGIKLKPGSSLEAVECKFFESNQFAVSGLNHVSLKVTACEFSQSGVQSVGGPTEVRDSKFQGVEGVYVSQSGETASTITNCDFVGCFEYGVEVTENGEATIENSRFQQCKFGVQVADGNAVVNGCEFTECGSSGVDLTGGTLRVMGDTVIKQGRKFGCTVSDGNLDLRDVQLIDIADAGIIAKGVAQLRIENTTFSGCGSCAIDMIEGTLELLGGSIRNCNEAGLFLSEVFTSGNVKGTQFIDNPGGAMLIEAGELTLEDVAISGGDTGILIRPGGDSSVVVTLSGASFKEVADFAIDLEGDVKLDVFSTDFGDIPVDKRIQALGDNAKVTVHL